MTHEQRDRVKLVIAHEYAQVPGQCAPGEEVVGAFLIWRGWAYPIPLSVTHLILFDFLCRHRWIAMDASAIATRLRMDLFVIHHGSNAPGHQVRPARTSRTAVRKQVERIRAVLTKLIADEGLDMDALKILRSEESSTRSVSYRINADVSFEHWATTGDPVTSRTIAGIPLSPPDHE